MGKIIGIGGISYDHIGFIDKMPNWNTTEYMSKYLTQHGGIVSTALLTAAKLGNQVEYIGGIGDDIEGKKILSILKSANVEINQVQVFKNQSTPTSLVLVNNQTGDRTIIHYRGVQFNDRLNLNNIDFTDISYIHIDGFWYRTFLENVSKIDTKKTKIIVDPSSCINEEIADKIFPIVDYIIPSYIYASKFTSEKNVWKACEKIMKYSPKAVIITKGSEGSFIMTNDERKHIPAIKVKAINTNGAGDVFHGGFISALNDNKNIFEAAKYASYVAGLKCTKTGGIDSIPNYEEVKRFIDNNQV
ncbi:MAG: carbohydrate kinase family protein [Clostridiales bacterium]